MTQLQSPCKECPDRPEHKECPHWEIRSCSKLLLIQKLIHRKPRMIVLSIFQCPICDRPVSFDEIFCFRCVKQAEEEARLNKENVAKWTIIDSDRYEKRKNPEKRTYGDKQHRTYWRITGRKKKDVCEWCKEEIPKGYPCLDRSSMAGISGKQKRFSAHESCAKKAKNWTIKIWSASPCVKDRKLIYFRKREGLKCEK